MDKNKSNIMKKNMIDLSSNNIKAVAGDCNCICKWGALDLPMTGVLDVWLMCRHVLLYVNRILTIL